MNRRNRASRSLGFAALTSLLLVTMAAHTQSFTVLHNFTGGADGGTPVAGVTFDQQGRIYGTTSYGGVYQDGAVYRLARAGQGWALSPIYSFGGVRNDGKNPYGRVVFGPDGLLYGTTSAGGTAGYGTVFSLRPPASACKAALCPWQETVIHNFAAGTDGADPAYGDLVFDNAGNIYGTTFNGGAGGGLVFELSRSGGSWTETVLWRFTYNGDGAYPVSGVVFDNAGNLYGTTSIGSSHGDGAVYELSPTQSGWAETTLYSFTNGTCCGDGSLTWDTHGNLFGIAGFAPNEGEGNSTAYELTPQTNGTWSFTALYNLGDQYTGPAAAPTFDAQGNLYGPLPSGAEGNFGAIFRLTPSGDQWLFDSFYQFISCNDGNSCFPIGAVSFDASGNMYGTASVGGTGGSGTVWEITP